MQQNFDVMSKIQDIRQDMMKRISAMRPQTESSMFNEIFAQKLSADDGQIRYVKADTKALNSALKGAQTQFKAPTATSKAAPMSASMDEKKQIYAPLVKQAAAKYNLPENLINAVIRAESAYNPQAVSKVGAQGLMQLMPTTARELGVSNSFDPAQNIDGGAKYLRQMLDRFNGDLKLALASYNAGPNHVSSLGLTTSNDASAYTRLSSGVRSYVSTVLSYMN